MTYPNLCCLIKIMISIPPNTGWVERSYSMLEMICQKRRNKMAIDTLRPLFMLAVLKLPVRNDAFDYSNDMDNL